MHIKKPETHLLVIEDDPDLLSFMAAQLLERGYLVRTARNGVEAVELVRRFQFNLVVSDLKMPLMDGITAMEVLKKIDPHLEVIMISGQADVEMAVRAMKLGAFDFLEKPIVMEKLLVLIEKALEKSEMRVLLALYQMSRTLFSSGTTDDLLAAAMNTIYAAFKADEGSLMMLDEDDYLRIKHSRGLSQAVVRTTHLRVGDRIAGAVAVHRKPLLLTGSLEDYPEFKGLKSRADIQSAMVVPLQYQESFLGVLNLSRTQCGEPFTAPDLRNLLIFCAQLAPAVYSSRLGKVFDSKLDELKRVHETLREAKAELMKTDRGGVSVMVAGLVHELNNPLTAMMGYTELLLNHENLPENAKKMLTTVARSAGLCKALVEDMLNYSRRRKPDLQKVDLHQILQEALFSASIEIQKHAVHARLSCPRDCPPVRGDESQLGQVFFNLIRNACQALEARASKRHLVIKAVPGRDGCVRILVMDNGPGVPEDAVKRLFTPFFTTKSAGEGTGLGLAVVRNILLEHDGTISVARAHRGGALFTVSLPVYSTPMSPPGRLQIAEDKTSIL